MKSQYVGIVKKPSDLLNLINTKKKISFFEMVLLFFGVIA